MLELEEQIQRHATWLDTKLPTVELPPVDLRAPEMPFRELPPRDLRGSVNGAGTKPVDAAERYPVETTRRGHRRLLTAAVVGVAAAVVAALVLIHPTTRHDTVRSGSDDTTTSSVVPPDLTATGPDSAVIPGSTPPGMELWSIDANPAPNHGGLITTFEYMSGTDGARHLEVTTCPGGLGGGCAGSYADERSVGTLNSDGSVTAIQHPYTSANSTTSTDAGIMAEVRVWPNGAGVSVSDSYGNAPLDLDLAAQVAASVHLTDQAALISLRNTLSDQLSALPVLASADLANGRVELHGEGVVRAVCVRPILPDGSPAELTCPSAALLSSASEEDSAPYTGSLLYGSQWVVAAATPNPGTLGFNAQPADGDVGHLPPGLPAERTGVTTDSGTYQLGIVFVPADISSIFSVISQGQGFGGGGSDRPPF
jgi:hypothetical protein